MFKNPSSRRKSDKNKEIGLNLVPMMDAMVTIIAFLMYSMTFLAFVSIESPVPLASSKTQEKKLKEKPLQLTVSVQKDGIEVWSPFNRIRPQKIKNLEDGAPDLIRLHESIIAIKEKFPKERQVVFAPRADTKYDTIVGILDSIRTIEDGDPPIYAKDEAGTDVLLDALFPEIVFGNLLGGS